MNAITSFITNPDGTPRDFDDNTKSRFDAIVQRAEECEEPEYGSDELLVDFKLHFDSEDICEISLSPEVSKIWHDKNHIVRLYQPSTSHVEHRALLTGQTNGDASLDELPLFSHWQIAPHMWDFRVLQLLPHQGNPSSPVVAELVTTTLFLHNCYTAVRNSRGNPALTSSIMLNFQRRVITKNLEVFLRHMRLRDTVRSLWIRELCVNKDDKEERSICFNWTYQKIVEDCSCGILLMDRVMEALEDNGLLLRNFKPREKAWGLIPPQGQERPRHHPVHLGRSFEDEEPFLAYKYLPLDLTAEEVRLVVLQPSEDRSAPLTAFVAHEPMHGEIPYGALSYTWGSALCTEVMTVNGQLMSITSNLDQALRDIRLQKGVLVIWIDAICIDQANEHERSRHIPRMQEIYDAADGVYVWLGPITELVHNGLGFARELYQPELTAFDREAEDERKTVKRTTRLAKAWAAAYELLYQPFFRRRWIIQELASANTMTVITGTGTNLPWHSIEIVGETLEFYWDEVYQLWKDYKMMPQGYRELEILDEEWISNLGMADIRSQLSCARILSYVRHLRAAGQSPSFLLLAILSQEADCADPRDRIYALWNISNDCKELVMQPDYSKSVEEVYVDFVKAYTSYHCSLDLICSTQVPIAGQSVPEIPEPLPLEVPAWCLDWRHAAHLHTFVRKPTVIFTEAPVDEVPASDHAPYHADTFCEPHDSAQDDSNPEKPALFVKQLLPFAFEGHTLLASGIVFDTIAQTSHFPLHWSTTFDGPPSEWRDLVNAHHRNPDGSTPSAYETLDRFAGMMLGEPPDAINAIPNDVGYEIHFRRRRKEEQQ